MNRTQIEWVKNPDGTQGYTWNPITGCLNHINGMCKGGNFPCYAYKLAKGRLRKRYLDNINTPDIYQSFEYNQNSVDPFYPRLWMNRLANYSLTNSWYDSKGIFVCDMSDLFSKCSRSLCKI